MTGAGGLLGSHLVRMLAEQDRDVVAIFHRQEDMTDFAVETAYCDIRSRKEVLALKISTRPQTVIVHCAAITNVDACEKDKDTCSAVNDRGTAHICELAQETNATLIYISTASVFDGIAGNYQENDIPKPVNTYSASKLAGEKHVLTYARGLVIRTIPLGLYSETRQSKSLLEWIVDCCRRNRDMKLFSDVMLNPLSASTLASMIVRIPSTLERGILHLGSRDVVSKADIGREVVSWFPGYAGRVRYVSIDEELSSTERPKRMVLNVDKARSLGLDLPEALADIRRYLASRLPRGAGQSKNLAKIFKNTRIGRP